MQVVAVVGFDSDLVADFAVADFAVGFDSDLVADFAVAVGSDLDLDLVEHHLQQGLLIQLVVTLHHLARIVFLAIMQ